MTCTCNEYKKRFVRLSTGWYLQTNVWATDFEVILSWCHILSSFSYKPLKTIKTLNGVPLAGKDEENLLYW